MDQSALLQKFEAWNIGQETIAHALSPTCEIHSQNLRGTAFEKYIGNGQAKNLFFKVPSGGGPLKNQLFLVCALVETAVDNKVLSGRLGIKPSAPLRLAADDIFTDVLQIPKGSVNPFVMAQESCSQVTLLLDKKFLECERLLFHPMQSDYTTAIAPAELKTFLERAGARFAYVDLGDTAKLELPAAGVAKVADKAVVKKEQSTQQVVQQSAPKVQTSIVAEEAAWFTPPWQEKEIYFSHQRWLQEVGM